MKLGHFLHGSITRYKFRDSLWKAETTCLNAGIGAPVHDELPAALAPAELGVVVVVGPAHRPRPQLSVAGLHLDQALVLLHPDAWG